jgi:MFS transporter, DHA1 family, multidrug resistance protein
MLWIKVKRVNIPGSLRASSNASLALALASFGDAFLYAFLPVNSVVVGVPVLWVGVLLSVNRFVRIISNNIMVHVFARYGLRMVIISAVIVAILSTLGYSFASSIFLWLVFRVAWGLSFSAMRIGTLGYAIQNENKGVALGLSRSLQETGPALALFFAPLLLSYFNSTDIFLLLAALSTPALYFAWRLPKAHDRIQPESSKLVLQWPSTVNAITLLSAILIDGIVIVVLGILFLHFGDNLTFFSATALAAFYLGYRRICLVVLSPAGGWIADKFGLDKVFNLSMCLVIVGLIVLLLGWVGIGSVIVFTFYSINAAITPGAVSSGKTNSLAAVAENATWRDVGAAIGTLLGGVLIASSYLTSTLLIAIFGLAFFLFVHMVAPRKRLKFSIYGSSRHL